VQPCFSKIGFAACSLTAAFSTMEALLTQQTGICITDQRR
jgi:hypothetical protein